MVTARITFKQYRFESLALIVVTGVVAAWQLLTILVLGTVGGACRGSALPDPATCAPALGVLGAVTAVSVAASGVSLVFPVLIGLLVGVQLVGREVERGTAGLPWLFGRSRVRWLLPRLAMVALLVGTAGLILGLLSDAVLAARMPGLDLARSLTEYEIRGWLVPARALAAFGVGVAAGTLIGRVLPALLVAVIAGGLLLGALELGFGVLHTAQAQPLGDSGGLFVEYRYLDRGDGAYVSEADAEAAVDYDGAALQQRYEQVAFGLPDPASRAVIGTEVAAFVAVFVVGAAVSLVAVRRRPPY